MCGSRANATCYPRTKKGSKWASTWIRARGVRNWLTAAISVEIGGIKASCEWRRSGGQLCRCERRAAEMKYRYWENRDSISDPPTAQKASIGGGRAIRSWCAGDAAGRRQCAQAHERQKREISYCDHS